MSLEDITRKYQGTELAEQQTIDTVTNTGYLSQLKEICKEVKSFGEGFVMGTLTHAYFFLWMLNFGMAFNPKDSGWIKNAIDAENKMLFSHAEKIGYTGGLIGGFFAAMSCGVLAILCVNHLAGPLGFFYLAGTMIATNTFGSYYFPYKRRKERVKDYLQLPSAGKDI